MLTPPVTTGQPATVRVAAGDLARPWGLAKSGPGPMLARAQVRDPKISDAKEQSFFQKVSQGSPKGICMVWS